MSGEISRPNGGTHEKARLSSQCGIIVIAETYRIRITETYTIG